MADSHIVFNSVPIIAPLLLLPLAAAPLGVYVVTLLLRY
jgi:hypothetical protein